MRVNLVMIGSSVDIATLRQLIHLLSVLNFQTITVITSYWLNPPSFCNRTVTKRKKSKKGFQLSYCPRCILTRLGL